MNHDFTKNIARVLSFNIKVGVDSSLTQVASDLCRLNTKLCAFQEIGQHWSLGRSLDQTHYLASAQGHAHHVFMPLLKRDWSSDPYQGGPFVFEAVNPLEGKFKDDAVVQGSVGHYGIGLSAAGFLDHRTSIYLPYTVDEQRGAQVFTWSYGEMSQAVTVLNTHLSVNESERWIQVEYIVDYLRKVDGPLLILGDFNDTTRSSLLQYLESELELRNLASHFALENEYSFSVKVPNRRIDHILGRGLKVHDFGVAKSIKSSDHFPIWADISW